MEDVENKMKEYNQKVTSELMPKWCSNIADNLEIARGSQTVSAIPKHPGRSAIIIGAGPSLKDDDIRKLQNYTGTIICCNKSFERLMKLGVTPNWVMLLDADAISAPQFRFLDFPEDEHWLDDTKFFVSTQVYPGTLKTIERHAKCGNLYMVNPVADPANLPFANEIWGWMNGCEPFEHGGNVGGFSLNLAMTMMFSKIGLLGFDLTEEPDRKWTFKESMEREIFWYPDTGEYVHVPLNFMYYAQWMFHKAMMYEAGIVVNLSESPLMRHARLAQHYLEEFIVEGQ